LAHAPQPISVGCATIVADWQLSFITELYRRE